LKPHHVTDFQPLDSVTQIRVRILDNWVAVIFHQLAKKLTCGTPPEFLASVRG
jgi:hypothetical protein